MKSGSMKSRQIIALFTLIFVVTGINIGIAGDEIPAEAITIFTTSPAYEFEVCTTLQFLAYVEPEDATDRKVVWFSSDPDIATIDPHTGLAEGWAEGKVTISAHTTDGSGIYKSVGLVVKPRGNEYLAIEPDSVIMRIGDDVELRVTVKTDSVADTPLQWSSSNADVATVSPEGVVKAVSCGETVIRARYVRPNGSGLFAVTYIRVADAASTKITNNKAELPAVSVHENRLSISGVADDALIEVHTLDGRCIVSDKGIHSVSLPGAGVYILRAGSSVFKVAVR